MALIGPSILECTVNRYDEFEDVPPYLMAEDTDPSVIPDPDTEEAEDVATDKLDEDDEVSIEDVVEELHKDDDDDEEEEEDDVDIDVEEDDDDIVVGVDDEDSSEEN